MLKKIGIENWPYSNESWNSSNETKEWWEIIANMMREGLVVADGFIELPIVNVEVGINDFNEDFHSLKIMVAYNPPIAVKSYIIQQIK